MKEIPPQLTRKHSEWEQNTDRLHPGKWTWNLKTTPFASSSKHSLLCSMVMFRGVLDTWTPFDLVLTVTPPKFKNLFWGDVVNLVNLVNMRQFLTFLGMMNTSLKIYSSLKQEKWPDTQPNMSASLICTFPQFPPTTIFPSIHPSWCESKDTRPMPPSRKALLWSIIPF